MMAKEIKKLKLEDRDFTGDYVVSAIISEKIIGITTVQSEEANTVLLSHADARKLAEFILDNIKEER